MDNMIHADLDVVIVPPGDYILGDPSYSIPEGKWRDLIEGCDFFDHPIGAVDGVEVLAFMTHHGDGIYDGPNDSRICVDTGLIGLVPVDLPGRTTKYDHMAARVTFLSPAVCKRHKNGTLKFGSLRVKTGW